MGDTTQTACTVREMLGTWLGDAARLHGRVARGLQSCSDVAGTGTDEELHSTLWNLRNTAADLHRKLDVAETCARHIAYGDSQSDPTPAADHAAPGQPALPGFGGDDA